MKTTDNDDQKTLKLVNFKSKQQQEQEQLDTNIKEAIQDCKDQIKVEDCSALFTITINKEGNPNILFAGHLDPLKMIGVLEMAKPLFLDVTPTIAYDEFDEGYDDTE